MLVRYDSPMRLPAQNGAIARCSLIYNVAFRFRWAVILRFTIFAPIFAIVGWHPAGRAAFGDDDAGAVRQLLYSTK